VQRMCTAVLSPNKPLVVGVVLCGGASRRMGRDKSLLAASGLPLVARPIAALRAAGVGEVLTVGGDIDGLQGLADGHVADVAPGQGPLGGIASVALARPGAQLLVAACDLPGLTAATVTELWSRLAVDEPLAEQFPVAHGVEVSPGASDRHRPIAVVGTVGGVEQWACLAVSSDGAASAVEQFRAGTRSLRAAFANAVRMEVTDPGSLSDVDDPESLADWELQRLGFPASGA